MRVLKLTEKEKELRMSTAKYESVSARYDPGYRSDTYDSSDSGLGSTITSMITAPFWMTAAGIKWMSSGVQSIGDSVMGPSMSTSSNGTTKKETTESSRSSSAGGGQSWTEWANPANWVGGSRPWNDQDLSGDDLKYVSWTIVFTKPGFEAALEPMQHELVAYNTDSSSYAALKIAKFLERARFGKVDRPHGWIEHDYPREPANLSRRTETSSTSSKTDNSKHESKQEKETAKSEAKEGWRFPSDDQKYVQFLYRVEWRIPKRETETTRVERVTVERTANAHARIVV